MPLIKDIDINYIREHKGEVNWSIISTHYKFTIDQLRQFQNLIDWKCYFIYNYRHIQTAKEALQFKYRNEDWICIFHYKKAGKRDLKRWMWEMVQYDKTWKWIIKTQKLDIKWLVKNFGDMVDWENCLDILK